MSPLVWKEWRENRAIIPMTALLMAVLFTGIAGYIHYSAVILHTTIHTSDFTGPLLIFFFVVPPALCSCSMIAGEIGNGTLRFLLSTPVTRNGIWWTKIMSSSAIATAAFVASLVVYFALYHLLHSLNLIDPPPTDYNLEPDTLLIGFTAAFLAFGAGCVATVLVDRTVTALSALAGISVLASFIIGTTVDALLRLRITGIVIPVVATLLTLSCLAYSNRVFVRQTLLLSRSRTRLLLNLLIDLGIIVGALVISLNWLIN